MIDNVGITGLIGYAGAVIKNIDMIIFSVIGHRIAQSVGKRFHIDIIVTMMAGRGKHLVQVAFFTELIREAIKTCIPTLCLG